MNKIQSLDDLERLRDRLRAEFTIRENSNYPELLPQIRVSMGTCGIAAGAKELLSHLVELLAGRSVRAVVTQTECMGCCAAEPVVEVEMPGRPVVRYGDVTPECAVRIVEEHILNGKPVDGLIIQ